MNPADAPAFAAGLPHAVAAPAAVAPDLALPAGARYVLGEDQARRATLRAAVCIPARDEAERIFAALEAVRCQWDPATQRPLGEAVACVLVVNGTTDETLQRVCAWAAAHPRFRLTVVDADFAPERAHVGTARRLALDLGAGLLAAGGCGGDGLLLSTDADSRLRYDALARGLGELQRADAFGAHIVAGEPDHSRIGLLVNRYGALRAELRHRLYREPHDRTPPHGVFGGAGFGLTVRAYRLAGGLPEQPYDEDQELRRRLLSAGLRVSYPRDVVVATSTRTDGRTPWGMARQLAAWAADDDAGRMPAVPGASALAGRYRAKAALRDRFPDTPLGRQGFYAAWRERGPGLRSRLPEDCPLPQAIAQLEAWLASGTTGTSREPLEDVEPVAVLSAAA